MAQLSDLGLARVLQTVLAALAAFTAAARLPAIRQGAFRTDVLFKNKKGVTPQTGM